MQNQNASFGNKSMLSHANAMLGQEVKERGISTQFSRYSCIFISWSFKAVLLDVPVSYPDSSQWIYLSRFEYAGQSICTADNFVD